MLVGAGRGHSDELLHSSRLSALSPTDKGLATALVLGVLRWQIALDARLRGLLARPETRVAEEVLIALRMAAFQLLHMDRIPAHAAVGESVELTRWSGQAHAAGMVNAVLRRLLGEPTAAATPIWETTQAFAERLGHPGWIAERWMASYGRKTAMRLCEAGQAEPAKGCMFCDGCGSPPSGDGATPTGARWDAEDAELAPANGDAVGTGVDRRRELPVMDDGSRLVAEIAAEVLLEVPGRKARVWDCCAAPGGKTMVLARQLGSRAEILATDVSARRLGAMVERLQASGYSEVRCGVSDVTALPETEGSFDLILCDVPCSGTGTLARNPEIRHRLRVEDIPRHAERQGVLLRAALDRLAPGGRLVYSTCSLEAEECERVVDGVAGKGSVTRVSVAPVLEDLRRKGTLRKTDLSMIRGDALRTLPGVHPCDGFFAAVLERLEATEG